MTKEMRALLILIDTMESLIHGLNWEWQAEQRLIDKLDSVKKILKEDK